MTNSDVTFTSTPSLSLSDNAKQSSPAVASNITLNQLPTLTRNQKVNVTGILTLGQTPAKEVKKEIVRMERSRRIALSKMQPVTQSSTYGMTS